VANRPTVGVLSTSFGGSYFGFILGGIAQEIAAVGGRMLAVQTSDAGTFMTDLPEPPDFRHPVAWDHISAFVVLLNAVDQKYLEAIRDSGRPVVGVSHREAGFDYPVVFPDNRPGIATAVTHLVEHGHRRIAFAGFTGQDDIAERYDEFRRTLAAHGLEPDPALHYDTTNNQESGGERVARAMLSHGLPATATICGNDANAMGFMRVLQAAGVRLPQDHSVVGFDDVDAAVYLRPSLSTVRQPLVETGATAARLVLGELAGRPAARIDHRRPTSFVARESCGCPSTLALPDADGSVATIASVRELAQRLGGATGPAELIAEVLSAAAVNRPGPDEPAVRDALTDLLTRHPLPETTVAAMRCLRRYGRHVTESQLAAGDTAAALRVEDRVQELIQGLAQVRERIAFLDTVDFGAAYRAQHQVSMDLLRSHEQAPRTLGWLRGTGTSAGRLALWAPTSPDGRDVAALDVVGAFDAAPDQPSAVGQRLSIQAFPSAELIEQADPAAGDVVFVAPAKVNQSDRGMLAGVGPLDPWSITGREAMNHWAALVTIALDHEATLESLRHQEEQLRHAARYDELTGLANRSLFVDRLRQAISRSQRSGYPFAVLMLDLDGFKRINDSLGHLAGDRLLIAMAERLSTGLRELDLAARFGGDEFAILLEGVEHPYAPAEVARRLHDALAEPFALDGQPVVVSASIGIAHSDGLYHNAEDLIRDADIAMYAAKSREKGTHAVFDVAMHERAVGRLRVEADLRRAVSRSELEVHYQPIVDLRADRPAGAEALIRWRHPTRGLVPPAEFLAVAEDSGLMVEIGRQVLEDACFQLARWHRALPSADQIRMSVNVSNRQFWHGHLARDIEDCLNRAGVQPRHLAVEITEGVIMHDIRIAQRALEELHDLGVELHIDDFGTGYSSLATLHQLPIDVLKIDRSFVSGLSSGPNAHGKSRELVRTIVTMGDNLGMELVAEGIETVEQQAEVQRLGCRYGQGYLFGRPIPGDEAEAYLREHLP
jgi:diguanylate cyclase (GGDEF)-like protein